LRGLSLKLEKRVEKDTRCGPFLWHKVTRRFTSPVLDGFFCLAPIGFWRPANFKEPRPPVFLTHLNFRSLDAAFPRESPHNLDSSLRVSWVPIPPLSCSSGCSESQLVESRSPPVHERRPPGPQRFNFYFLFRPFCPFPVALSPFRFPICLRGPPFFFLFFFVGTRFSFFFLKPMPQPWPFYTTRVWILEFRNSFFSRLSRPKVLSPP